MHRTRFWARSGRQDLRFLLGHICSSDLARWCTPVFFSLVAPYFGPRSTVSTVVSSVSASMTAARLYDLTDAFFSLTWSDSPNMFQYLHHIVASFDWIEQSRRVCDPRSPVFLVVSSVSAWMMAAPLCNPTSAAFCFTPQHFSTVKRDSAFSSLDFTSIALYDNFAALMFLDQLMDVDDLRRGIGDLRVWCD